LKPPRILVCDDEPAARLGVVRALGEARYDLVECAGGEECLAELAARGADLVLLDLRMPGLDGRAVLDRIRAAGPAPPVVVLTADSSLRSAIDAVKAGAADYLAKPYDIEELRLVVERSLERAVLKRENGRLREEVRRLSGSSVLLGESETFRAALDAAARVAPALASVLLTGETGTGKELFARRIHETSSVASGPFVAVNCAAIPDTLVEAELFGHRRGAFTGADRDRVGRVQEADGGTLFLDEIGDMPGAAQAKLLRVLEGAPIEPLGGGRPASVTIRVVSATHRDLRKLVAEGRFREDLLFRLRVVEIALPALRERGDDVLLLARHLLDGSGRVRLQLGDDAKAALLAHRWPGNVRELRNAIEHAAIFCRGSVIGRGDLPAEVRGAPAGANEASAFRLAPGEEFASAKERVVARFEREVLSAALKQHAGNVSQAARSVGLHRQNVQQKMRELGLDAEEFRR
jgi:DNA-binding NtrC family response regulator